MQTKHLKLKKAQKPLQNESINLVLIKEMNQNLTKYYEQLVKRDSIKVKNVVKIVTLNVNDG